jgi:hypothetical protein
MIRRFLNLFRRRRIPVIEIPGYIPQERRESMIATLKKGEPMVLEGGARLVHYEK